MTPLPGLAARSLWNRRGTAALTVFSIAVSVMLLTGVVIGVVAAHGAIAAGAPLTAGLVPAWLAYRRTLADGLTIRT